MENIFPKCKIKEKWRNKKNSFTSVANHHTNATPPDAIFAIKKRRCRRFSWEQREEKAERNCRTKGAFIIYASNLLFAFCLAHPSSTRVPRTFFVLTKCLICSHISSFTLPFDFLFFANNNIFPCLILFFHSPCLRLVCWRKNLYIFHHFLFVCSCCCGFRNTRGDLAHCTRLRVRNLYKFLIPVIFKAFGY